MKSVKLVKDDNVTFVEAGLVLNELVDELMFPPEFTGTEADVHTEEIWVKADMFRVTIEHQQYQIKVDIRKVKSFDDVCDEVEERWRTKDDKR